MNDPVFNINKRKEIDIFLDNYDWRETFAFAGDPEGHENPPDVNIVNGDEQCSNNLFSRKDVVIIYGARAGENDEEEWLIWGRIQDGRFFYIEAGCDYTGWDCQSGGRCWVASTKEKLIKFGMGPKAGRVFGLMENWATEVEKVAVPVDYRKLLKRCMEQWVEDEGGCWDVDFQEDLSKEERDAVKEVYNEINKEK